MRLLAFLAACVVPTFAVSLPWQKLPGPDNATAWSRTRADVAAKQFQGKRMPSPAFWGREIVYGIQVDRFNDGDLSNDQLNLGTHDFAACCVIFCFISFNPKFDKPSCRDLQKKFHSTKPTSGEIERERRCTTCLF